MVLSLEDAVTILSKWKDDSAHILVVCERPFQQSRRGILEQGIDWTIGLQGKVSKVSVNRAAKGEKKLSHAAYSHLERRFHLGSRTGIFFRRRSSVSMCFNASTAFS